MRAEPPQSQSASSDYFLETPPIPATAQRWGHLRSHEHLGMSPEESHSQPFHFLPTLNAVCSSLRVYTCHAESISSCRCGRKE